jgi:Plasmid replication region DNA-binding N-term
MPKLTDTYTLAYACCEQVLIETGKFPTIDAIRTRIGVNSPTTINNAIKAWTQDFAERQLAKQNRPDIPATLHESVEKIWQLATKEAEKDYLPKEQAFNNQLFELNQQLAEREVLLAEQAQQLAGLNDDKTQALVTIAALQTQAEQDLQRYQALQLDMMQLENQLQHKDNQLQEQEKTWQERQAQDQQWFARRLQEEKNFIEQSWQQKYQRQQETIQSLLLSEESLRQTCVSLSREHKKVLDELQALQQSLQKKRRGMPKNRRFPKPF